MNMRESAKIICLTPVKNEAWILDDFLAATSLWADYIIVADQMSDDGSREIASKYEKVILIDNNSPEFNEPERQKLLIDESRKIPGKKVLIALDADEFLAAESIYNGDLDKLRTLDEGAVIRFKWPFISSDFSYYWNGECNDMAFGFVDDGSDHTGRKIHSTRIPTPNNGLPHFISNISVMHFQFTDWKRMESKHNWYQCYEKKSFPRKSVVSIFRRYSHMYRINGNDKHPIGKSWFEHYSKNDIDLKKNRVQENYYWDSLTNKMVIDNPELYKNIDLPCNNSLILTYLRKTKRINSVFLKIVDKLISFVI
ncbi:glycosyltransferase family 2 protein [Vibrio splendidus]